MKLDYPFSNICYYFIRGDCTTRYPYYKGHRNLTGFFIFGTANQNKQRKLSRESFVIWLLKSSYYLTMSLLHQESQGVKSAELPNLLELSAPKTKH